MSFKEMVLQRGDYRESLVAQDKELSFVETLFKSQSPLMLGWIAIMGVNLVILLVSFQ